MSATYATGHKFLILLISRFHIGSFGKITFHSDKYEVFFFTLLSLKIGLDKKDSWEIVFSVDKLDLSTSKVVS